MSEKKSTIGINVPEPSKTCQDRKCPFHGEISVRGRQFTGLLLAKDVHGSATVEWDRLFPIPKYERFEKRRTKVRVHNPKCIDAQKGDRVRIMECKPLSKTKTFVVIENLGKQFGFEQLEEGRLASKHVSKKEKEDIAVKPKKKATDGEEADESN